MIGEVFENNAGQQYVVVEREGKSKSGNIKWRIRFISTGYETVVEKVQIKRGKIKDRYAKDIFSVGYVGDVDVAPNKKQYNLWYHMLERCYDPVNKAFPDYGAKGVSVDTRWHSFEQFLRDIPLIDGYHETEYGIGNLDLDKDKKQDGALKKVYSLETCTFMTKSENASLVGREHLKKRFLATDPAGQVHTVVGLKDFARDHGLIRQGITNCLQGRAKTHKGWTFQYPE